MTINPQPSTIISPAPLRTLLFLLTVPLLLTGCASSGHAGGRDTEEDLTRQPWFPPVTRQQSFSCSQQVALYYLLTAEWNRTQRQNAASPFRRFSPYFAYSLLAGDASGRSHVVDGWIVAREAGAPLEADCPRFSRTLMHGYDRYLRAMKHRVEGWDLTSVADNAGIEKAKGLLTAGHLLACDFQIKGTVLRLTTEKHYAGRPSVSPAATPKGEKFVHQWGRTGPGHAMVYAGYDDYLGFDSNGDGRITDDRDITGDGVVSLADRETGAFLVINPWGGAWGQRGRAWAPYRHHAASKWPWSRSVATVRVAPPHQPRLTLKLRLRASDRQNVVITCGNGRRSVQPWMFSHTAASGSGSGNVWDAFTTLRTAGPHLSAGSLAAPDGGPLETGHDLTKLGDGSSYTLEIRPAGRGALSGELTGASFMEYDGAGRVVRETAVTGLPVRLPAGGGVWRTPGR